MRSSKQTIIYGLVDPRTQFLRYVGKTTQQLTVRLAAHVNLKTHDYRGRWIASLLSQHVSPEIIEIERVPSGGDWREAEMFHIEYFRWLGCRLVNGTRGGEDAMQLHTEGVRRKRSLAMLWNTRWLGKTHTDETRRKMSSAAQGRRWSEDSRRKLSEARSKIRGWEHSEKTKRKISVRLRQSARIRLGTFRGRRHTEETKQKMSEHNWAKRPGSAEKISEMRRAYWARRKTQIKKVLGLPPTPLQSTAPAS